MYPASSKLHKLARSSGAKKTLRVDIVLPDGTMLPAHKIPPIADGTLNITESGVRRQANLTFESTSPSKEFLRALEKETTRFDIWSGLDSELVAQGQFYIKDYAIDDPGANKNYRLFLNDESALIATRKTTQTRIYNGSIIDVVKELIRTARPGVAFAGSTSVDNVSAVNLAIDQNSDPWQKASELLGAHGYEIFFDPYGFCVIRPVDNTWTDFAVNPFALDGLAFSSQTTIQPGAPSHVIVTSTNNGGAPVRGEWFDSDPNSSTYYYSDYGDVPIFIEADGIADNAVAEATAKRISTFVFGRRLTTVYSTVHLPVFEVGDSVMYQDEIYAIKQISVSLTYSRPMYITVRRGPANA